MRQYFDKRTQREKFLVVFMMAVALIIWGTLFLDRFSSLLQSRASLNRVIAQQQVWLDNRDIIRLRVEEGVRNLDPARTLSGNRLFVEVGSIARAHRLTPAVDSPRTEEADVFSYNTVTVRLNRALLADLINFTSDLQGRAPYMAIEDVTIRADQTDYRQLNAVYTISSVELNP